MNIRSTIRLFALSLMVLALAVSAHAQATRTWVSGVGDDVNPCSRTAPCKTFAGAISKTAASGEIDVLDPGGYGAVTITKSITINGRAQLSSILASLTNGVIVNAGVNDIVILRDLDINGSPETAPGVNGIRFIAGKTLSVERCNIYGFRTVTVGNGRGISVVPSVVATMNLFVSDTTITNGGGAGIGIQPSMAGSIVNVSVERSIIKQLDASGTTSGMFAGIGARVVIKDSEIAGNTVAGVDAANDARVLIENSSLINNARGVQAGGSSIVRLSRSIIANNATAGFVESGLGSVESANNNVFMNNGANIGSLTDILPD